MTREPANEDAASDTSEHSPLDENQQAGPNGQVPDRAAQDNGEVADKQIKRWKGEGGALHPDD